MKSITAAHSPEETNFRHLVLDIAWFGVALAASTRFLSVYAIRLGATAADLGWLASLPAIVLMISSTFGLWWLRRYNNDPTRGVFLPSLGFRFSFLLPAFAPFLPIEWQPVWLILSLAIPAIPQGVSSVIFLILMRTSVSEKRMTSLLSNRALAMNLTIAVGALAFGFWLEQAPFPFNYQAMFAFAFFATLISLWHVNRVRALNIPQTIVLPDAKKGTSPWRSASFIRIAFVSVTIHLAFFSILPLIPLHMVEGLGATEGFMALFGIAELVAGGLAAACMGRIVGRLGNRRVITLSMMGTAVAAFIVATAQALPITILAAALTGASWTAAGISLFTLFSESTSPEDVPGHTTAYMQLASLAMFIGPIIGSRLAENGTHLSLVLMIGVGLRLLAAALTQAEPGKIRLFYRRHNHFLTK